MREIRCLYCGKLLLKAEGEYKIEVKCSRCKQISNIENIKNIDLVKV